MAKNSEKIEQQNLQGTNNPNDSLLPKRRSFLKAGATLGAALMAAPVFNNALAGQSAIPGLNSPGQGQELWP